MADQESGFLVSVAFCPSIPGKTFPDCSVSHWGKSTEIGKLLRSHLSYAKWEGELSGPFYVKFICYQDHKHWRSSEVSCQHQRIGDKLPTGLVQISWESCFIRCHLLQFWEIVTFSSPDDMLVQSVRVQNFRCATWIQESVLWNCVA